jgi:DNA-binding response OmpR family regulator
VHGRILLVEGVYALARAVAATLQRRGYAVTVARSAAEAGKLPGPFDCGVFAERLPDGNGISLAGWLLAEDRVRCVVFFGDSSEGDVLLRASNLGSFVQKTEGIHALGQIVGDALRELDACDQAVGAETAPSGGFRREHRTGPRRRRS